MKTHHGDAGCIFFVNKSTIRNPGTAVVPGFSCTFLGTAGGSAQAEQEVIDAVCDAVRDLILVVL